MLVVFLMIYLVVFIKEFLIHPLERILFGIVFSSKRFLIMLEIYMHQHMIK